MQVSSSRWLVRGALSLAVAAALAGAFAGYVRAEDKEDKDDNEVKVTMDQLPAPVQATLKTEAGDGKIGDIDKEAAKGKTDYEADVVIGGKAYEIKIAEDGTLMSKQLDNEKDEKGKD